MAIYERSKPRTKLILSLFALCMIMPWAVLAQGSVSVTQTYGGVFSESRMNEWRSNPQNEFWAAVFSQRYGLAYDGRQVPGINPIPSEIGISWHYDVREELYQEASEIMDYYKRNGLLYEDPFLEDYLQRLLLDVCPGSMPPGRPGSLSIWVLRDSSPNAFALPNGTIVLNAGLISNLRTADELRAVIAHEVAHIFLDHSVEARIQEQLDAQAEARRVRRRAATAAILGSFAAGLAAYGGGAGIEDVALAAAYTGVVAGAVSVEYGLDRAKSALLEAGALHSQAQELQADMVSAEWAHFNGKPKALFIAALKRAEPARQSSASAADLSVYASHPPVSVRQSNILGQTLASSPGVTVRSVDSDALTGLDSLLALVDVEYDRENASLIELSAAISADVYGDYDTSIKLLTRLIQTGSPTASALVLASRVNRHMGHDDDFNQRSKTFIEEAESIVTVPRWDLLIEKAVLFSRIGRNDVARQALQELLEIDESDRPPTFTKEWIGMHMERLR